MAHRVFDDSATVRRGFCTVTRVVLLALLCAALLLSVVNDMYAFLKAEGEVHLTLDEPHSVRDFSRLLEDCGVLLNPHVFSLYVRAKERTALVESFSGELVLDRSMSYREILSYLAEHAPAVEAFSYATE